MAAVAEELDWRQFAECRKGLVYELYDEAADLVGTPGELLYPTKDHKRICGRCPVMQECLDVALNDPKSIGIWGGTTDYQRDQMRRNRPRVRCPRCTSDAVVPEHGTELCLSCGVSWPII